MQSCSSDRFMHKPDLREECFYVCSVPELMAELVDDPTIFSAEILNDLRCEIVDGGYDRPAGRIQFALIVHTEGKRSARAEKNADSFPALG